MALPKENRLKSKKDFDYIFKNGRAIRGRFLLIKYIGSFGSGPKIGFIAPSKVLKKAVDRNRAKRIMSEIVRPRLDRIVKNAVILLLRSPDKSTTRESIIEDLSKLIPNLYE